MNMEQIGKLLFATTLLTIFCYLLFFSSIGQSGNGGEYWGFDGYTEPGEAAQISYDKRDFRFLEVNIRSPFSGITQEAPSYQSCDNYPFGKQNALRPSLEDELHGEDSIRLATSFAKRYNETMTWLLSEQMNYHCEKSLNEAKPMQPQD